MHPIVERLKKRKLIQWALAYLAGAWLIVTDRKFNGPFAGGGEVGRGRG